MFEILDNKTDKIIYHLRQKGDTSKDFQDIICGTALQSIKGFTMDSRQFEKISQTLKKMDAFSGDF
ncbi:hypothetical protein D3C81_2276610 [compost metagenome]